MPSTRALTIVLGAAIAGVVIAAGCATSPPRVTEGNAAKLDLRRNGVLGYRANVTAENRVEVLIRHEGSGKDYQIDFTEVDSGRSVFFEATLVRHQPGPGDELPKLKLFQLPPGIYHPRLIIFTSRGTSRGSESRKLLPRKFEIRAGEISYLGDHVVSVRRGWSGSLEDLRLTARDEHGAVAAALAQHAVADVRRMRVRASVLQLAVDCDVWHLFPLLGCPRR